MLAKSINNSYVCGAKQPCPQASVACVKDIKFALIKGEGRKRTSVSDMGHSSPTVKAFFMLITHVKRKTFACSNTSLRGIGGHSQFASSLSRSKGKNQSSNQLRCCLPADEPTHNYTPRRYNFQRVENNGSRVLMYSALHRSGECGNGDRRRGKLPLSGQWLSLLMGGDNLSTTENNQKQPKTTKNGR